jgi:hypothetical protein
MTSHIMIGTPCMNGQVSSLYARSVLNFQKACIGLSDVRLELVAHWGDSLTTRARQGLVTQFLGHPAATHLLFLDGHIGFEPDQVLRLLKFDADITAAFPRQDNGLGNRSRESLRSDHSKFNFEPKESDPTGKNGFVKAHCASIGFMLLKRSALRAMVEKHKDLRYRSEFKTSPDDPRYWSYALFNCLIEEKTKRFLSADESFCSRWTSMGGDIWVDLESGQKALDR